jgi:hypothetical protein
MKSQNFSDPFPQPVGVGKRVIVFRIVIRRAAKNVSRSGNPNQDQLPVVKAIESQKLLVLNSGNLDEFGGESERHHPVFALDQFDVYRRHSRRTCRRFRLMKIRARKVPQCYCSHFRLESISDTRDLLYKGMCGSGDFLPGFCC